MLEQENCSIRPGLTAIIYSFEHNSDKTKFNFYCSISRLHLNWNIFKALYVLII
jgi:hypothetical protein